MESPLSLTFSDLEQVKSLTAQILKAYISQIS